MFFWVLRSSAEGLWGRGWEGVARNKTEDAGSEGGEAAGGAGLSPGAVQGENKKGAVENSTGKKVRKKGGDAGDAG